MEKMMISVFLMAAETWGSLFFFDTFMEQKKNEKTGKYRYWLLFLMIASAVGVSRRMNSNICKFFFVIFMLCVFCMLFYRVRWKQSLFFSGLNYSLIFLMDFLLIQVGSIWASKDFMQDKAHAFTYLLLALIAKMIWLSLLFILRKIWKGGNDYGGLSNGEWIKLGIMLLFTMIAMFTMFFCYSDEKRVQMVYLFLAAGMIMMNFLVIGLMQDILEKGKLLRESALTDQKNENQLAYYRDMQAVYERQGRKLHDYKNQIRTMQVLLKEGDIQTAAALAERLTESISVEMSAVNTNHPVVNAVLNQKFHAAREQGISMIFMVSDMCGLRLNEEETVILLSNLLDNAIHECVKVVQAEKKAVIHVKLVYEDGNLIFSVKNPVAKKVEIKDGIVLDSDGRKHGIGLANVKAVCAKYDGDFEIFCDSEKFQAVAML